MKPLNKTDFSWHADQPDVPNMSAAGMKAFLDAPIERLMEKVNEIIGGEDEQSLSCLTAALTEIQSAVSQKMDQKAVEDALANLDTLHREELAYKASTDSLNEEIAGVKAEAQDLVDTLARKEAEDHLEQATAIAKLDMEKQDKLIPGAGISILDNVISTEFASVQDTVTSDMPNGFCRFEDPGDESRKVFNLYLLQDNGNGGIEPGGGLSLERGSVALKTAVGDGYFIIVFRKAGGYLIYNTGLADEMTEMSFSGYTAGEGIAIENGVISLSVASAEGGSY